MKTHDSQPEVQVLLFLSLPEEVQTVQSALDRADLAHRSCACPEDLFERLDDAGAAILSQEALTAPVMMRLVQTLEGKPERAEYPFVLLFDRVGATACEAVRLLDLLEVFGSLTVLERPIRPLALVSAVRTAVRSRHSQRRARELVQHLRLDLHDRDQRLAGLIHKLRIPLNTILKATEILDRVGALNQAAAEQRALVRRQTLLLTQLLGEAQEPWAGNGPTKPTTQTGARGKSRWERGRWQA